MTIEANLLTKGRRIGRRICDARGWTERFGPDWARGFVQGWAKGSAYGKAEAVLGVLDHREVRVSATLRQRILAVRDERKLERWFGRAFTVTSAKKLFEEHEASGRRSRAPSVPAPKSVRAGRRRVAA